MPKIEVNGQTGRTRELRQAHRHTHKWMDATKCIICLLNAKAWLSIIKICIIFSLNKVNKADCPSVGEELIIIKDGGTQKTQGSRDREDMYRYLSALSEQDQIDFAMRASTKGKSILFVVVEPGLEWNLWAIHNLVIMPNSSIVY